MTVNKRYLPRFLTYFAILCALAIYTAESAPTFRGDHAVRFDKLKDKDRIITTGMSRTQRVFIKAGYLEQSQPVSVGVFGNHQVQYLSSESFGPDKPRGWYFNFWGAASALADNRDYLLILEKLGILPKRIIVHITTPNNDNGDVILGQDHNMTPVLSSLGIKKSYDSVYDALMSVSQLAVNKVKNTFNYITFITGITGLGTAVIVNTDDCQQLKSQPRKKTWTDWLPNTVRSMVYKDDISRFCSDKFLAGAFLPDGSAADPEPAKPIINSNPLHEEFKFLEYGDEAKIAQLIREIIDIAKRNDRKLLFWVPPVYETVRESTVDNVFSRALAMLKDVPIIQNPDMARKIFPSADAAIIDHRYYGRNRPEIFFNYDHPNDKYYAEFVRLVRATGFLEAVE